MALKLATPRDRLDRVMDYVRRARRYWWLVMAFVVAGGALSVAFALTQPSVFQSQAVLFHQERIQSSLLHGRDADAVTRNIGDRYRELLLARTELAKVINDPELDPFPDVVSSDGVEAAVEALRSAITFSARGGNTFRISYRDAEPERARAVTEKLSELLIARDTALRTEQASMTKKFAEDQKAVADTELRTREHDLAAFLAQHPEFAQDIQQGANEGAAIRAGQKKKPEPATSNPRVLALVRQRDRLQARLDAPPEAPVRIPRSRTAAQIAADRAVEDAEREVASAQRSLEEVRGRVTDRHPDFRKASDAVAAAQQRLRRAEAAVPPDQVDVIVPVAAVDRPAMQKELASIEAQIDAERARDRARLEGVQSPKPAPVPDIDPTEWVVKLETEWAQLRREVDEQRQKVSTLESAVFVAETQANAQLAEQGGILSFIDHAYKPMRPVGKGKKMLVLVGLFLFGAMGLALAVGLAIIDDRVYRRSDLELLELAPVLAVIPRAPKRELS